jgi:hypothetical protein
LWFSSIEKQIALEQGKEEEKQKQAQVEIERKLIEAYGFRANTSLSVFQDAVRVRGETNANYYFSKPANLAFYDLTANKSLPYIVKSVLGQNLKFVPTPSHTTHDLSKSFTRLRRNVHLKTFFAVDETTADDIRIEKENMPALYIPNDKWWPPTAYIPLEVEQRLDNFQKHLAPHFKKRPGKPNLLQRFFETYAKMTISLSVMPIKAWVQSLLNVTSMSRTSLYISKTKKPTYNSPKLKHMLKPLESSAQSRIGVKTIAERELAAMMCLTYWRN